MAAPKLRFKEFDGDWERIKLSQMGTFKNGINKDKEDFGHGVPFINLMDVFGKNSICQNTFDLVNANSKEIEAYSLKQGDVLFIRSSVKPEGVAETAVVIEDLDNTVYSGFLIRYRPSKDIDLHYKKYCFSTDFFRKNVLALSTTSANTNINQESLSLLNLDLPSKPEQTKIASFLSNVDEKISQLTQKHALLSQYKQGMMQKLFSQQLRFKANDGSEFGEWEISKFDEVLSTISIRNNQIQASQILEEGDIPVIDQGQKYIAGYTQVISKILEPKSGLIIFGDHTTFLKYVDFSFVVGADGVKVLEVEKNSLSKYVYYYLCHNKLQPEGYKRHFTILREIEILVPCLAEQTKIANFLSAIDQKIEVVAQQIEQAKTWKKGLLQQMFI